MKNQRDLNILCRYILETSGVSEVDTSDCKDISEMIFHKTRKIISETTLKRLFGFAQRHSNFSTFTLNTLAEYSGFSDWGAFQKSYPDSMSDKNQGNWEKLRQRSMVITNYSLLTIKNACGIPFEQTVFRSYIAQDYQSFLNSEKLFTAMVTPSGHGKSILIAQLTEHFFTGEQALYPTDIPIVINGSVLNNLVIQGLDVEKWIGNEIGLVLDDGFAAHFGLQPEDSRGQVVLFFDGLNLENLGLKYFNQIIDLLLYYNQPWLKVVLAMDQASWMHLKQVVTESSHLLNQWYRGMFFDNIESCNIPYFTRREVAEVLSNINNQTISNDEVNDDTYQLLKAPSWFQIYTSFVKSNKNVAPTQNLIYYELIFKFTNQKIFNTAQSTQKIHLVMHIINQSHYDSKHNFVEKRYLLELLLQLKDEYKELLQSAILIEQTQFIANENITEVVKLHYPEVLPFLLGKKALLDADYKIDESFLQNLLDLYQENQDLLTKVMKWIVRYCVIQNVPQHLNLILETKLTRQVKNALIEFAYEVINLELAKTDSDFVKRGLTKPLITFLANGKILSKKFGRLLQKLKDLSADSEEVAMSFDLMLALIAIANYDKISLREILGRLEKLQKRIKRDFPIDCYELILAVYMRMTGNASQFIQHEKARAIVLDFCRKEKENLEPRKEKFTLKEMIAYRICLNILFVNRDFELSYEFITTMQHSHPNILLYRNSNFVHMVKITMGSTCLKTDNLRIAKKFHEHLETIMKDKNTYFAEYIAVVWFAFKAEYSLFFKDYKNALISINKAIQIAQLNELIIPCIGLTALKLEITRNMTDQEDFGDTFYDLALLLKTTEVDFDVLIKFSPPRLQSLLRTFIPHD